MQGSDLCFNFSLRTGDVALQSAKDVLDIIMPDRFHAVGDAVSTNIAVRQASGSSGDSRPLSAA
ncbi:hypothetical protein [Pararobbsia alpina]|uniref:hypothetical protein n=1 Tax=Pararobbsia alpina TaxID=621374 RepID=UPI001581FC47|nr:hypothetical protein [Pararobbsia alpina]